MRTKNSGVICMYSITKYTGNLALREVTMLAVVPPDVKVGKQLWG